MPVLGDRDAVHRFVRAAIQRFNGRLDSTKDPRIFELYAGELRQRFAARLGYDQYPLRVAFADPTPEGAVGLGRNHPIVSELAEAILTQALGPHAGPRLARAGAVATDTVQRRTAILVLRLRYLLDEGGHQQFAEEIITPAFERRDGSLAWLEQPGSDLLANARPVANISAEERSRHVQWALDMLGEGWSHTIVAERTRALEESHARLRAQAGGPPLAITPHEPPDIMGCYVLVTAGAAS